MPKNNRLADTINFLRMVQRPGGGPVFYAPAVADLLDGFQGNIPETVVQGMSMGTVGTKETRQYRRAMILMLCVIKNAMVTQARAAVDLIMDANLHASLEQMVRETALNYGSRTFTPIADQLLQNPSVFLTNNRVRLGRGPMLVSGPTPYELSWIIHEGSYLMEPPVAHHYYVHATVPGYNIHVQNYSAVKDELHNITGATVAGDLAITTELSGCTVIYRVNGPNLTVAHIMPQAAVRTLIPQDLAQYTGSPLGVIQTMRMTRDGNLAGGPGGTLGLFGMVDTPADTALRFLGARQVRTHGYTATWGKAYFMGVRVGGNWQLFGQQNNPQVPAAGVRSLMQLYP